MTLLTFQFRWPEDDPLTDERLAQLPGKHVTVRLGGLDVGPARIITAERYSDDFLGEGVWVSARRD